MAEPVDPKELVSIEEVAISSMWEGAAQAQAHQFIAEITHLLPEKALQSIAKALSTSTSLPKRPPSCK